MSEENKAIIRRRFDEMNKRNFAVLDELFAADYVHHPLGVGTEDTRGLEAFRQMVTTAIAASADTQVTIEDMVAEGDKVVARWTSQGTHKGEFMGTAPTGKQGTTTGITIFEIVGARL